MRALNAMGPSAAAMMILPSLLLGTSLNHDTVVHAVHSTHAAPTPSFVAPSFFAATEPSERAVIRRIDHTDFTQPMRRSSPLSFALSAKKKKKKGGGSSAKKGGTGVGFGAPPPPPKPPPPPTSSPSTATPSTKARPYVKSEQDALLDLLQSQSSTSPIGKAVAESPLHGTPDADPFYELLPSLIASRFPNARAEELERVAGWVRHALDPELELERSIVEDPWRPHEEIHAYMPSLPPTKPFHPPTSHPLCHLLSSNVETISSEYSALLEHGHSTLFQSVTSMNYDAGWQTLVLFYNGHRIPNFPYHLCPVTTQLLETVPLAGRIAGFSRQEAQTGIPLHSDGNNMWLTCQLGVRIPEGDVATIRVGPETRAWKRGECLLYDTTYEHETWNGSEKGEERVVLHVDFFNQLGMTELEIEVMEYVYGMREEFMKAEGVGKVGAQIL